jgi:steroid delta-isomerase-like uncharacterized protein
MSPDENQDIVLHLLHEVFTRGNTAALREFGTPNVTLHLAGYPDSFRGPDALQKWATTYLAAFEVQHIIDDVAADRDMVMVRWTMHSTQKGEYLGIPPTGRQVTFTALEWFRLENGKVAEVWSMFDTLSVMQQLGVFPKGRPPRALMWLIVRLQRLDRKRGEKQA